MNTDENSGVVQKCPSSLHMYMYYSMNFHISIKVFHGIAFVL